jgi:2-dehydro-3-deoxyphosphogluconate aldolase / (4S)-4-hydroxy-2-oxoglutarate aldolase
MRSRSEIVRLLIDSALIAVIRADSPEQVPPICDALLAGGISALEITLTTPEPLKVIRNVSAKLSRDALVGAGTVLGCKDCTEALDAGAQFVVTPICITDIIALAHERDRPAMIGAYTPTEAQLAHEAGADFIKIFPADSLGPGYIKSIRAPLPHLRIVPTGGVDLQTAPEFLKAGCVALGVGSSLVSNEIVRSRNWPELTRLAREYGRVVRETRAAVTREKSS